MLMIQYVRTMFRNQKGQGMVEYGLILALIAVVVIAATTSIGTAIKGSFEEIAGKL